jgi:PAS domain S-box-containing protein
VIVRRPESFFKTVAKNNYFIFLGLVFGIVFWILQASYDHYVTGLGSFWDCLIDVTEGVLAIRLIVLGLGIAMGVIGQRFAHRILQKQRLQVLFDKANDGLIVLDAKTKKIVDSNEKASRLLGFSHDELLDQDLASMHPHDFDLAARFIKDVMENGEGNTDLVSCRTKSGRILPADISASAMKLSGRIHVLVSIRDISDRIAAQDASHRAFEEMQRADQHKRQFLSSMSHELRTPLNAIIGFAGVLAEDVYNKGIDPIYRQYARDIKASGDHLHDLVNDILDLSKIEAGADSLNEERLDLRQLIQNALQVFREQALKKHIDLSVDLVKDLPMIYADSRKIKQILINILSNALKFTEEYGHVTISCRNNAGNGTTIEITDTGIGIDPSDLSKAFTPFQQIDSALNRKYEGTGLGLPLTKMLVEQHRGTLELSSTLGQGTRVVIQFPEARCIRDAEPGDVEPEVGCLEKTS